MPKKVVLVEHCSFEKKLFNGDGPLTATGTDQARELVQSLRLVLSSPQITILSPPLLRNMGTVAVLLGETWFASEQNVKLISSPYFFILLSEAADWRKIKSCQEGDLSEDLRELKKNLIKRVVNSFFGAIDEHADCVVAVGNEPFISALSVSLGGDGTSFNNGESRILEV